MSNRPRPGRTPAKVTTDNNPDGTGSASAISLNAVSHKMAGTMRVVTTRDEITRVGLPRVETTKVAAGTIATETIDGMAAAMVTTARRTTGKVDPDRRKKRKAVVTPAARMLPHGTLRDRRRDRSRVKSRVRVCTPVIYGDGDVVDQTVNAGEIEIDESAYDITVEQNVVAKQIDMHCTAWQALARATSLKRYFGTQQLLIFG